MAHFSKTAPPKRKLMLGVNDGPGAKKSKDGDDTEDSESDSSSGEESFEGNEVEISICQQSVGKKSQIS